MYNENAKSIAHSYQEAPGTPKPVTQFESITIAMTDSNNHYSDLLSRLNRVVQRISSYPQDEKVSMDKSTDHDFTSSIHNRLKNYRDNNQLLSDLVSNLENIV